MSRTGPREDRTIDKEMGYGVVIRGAEQEEKKKAIHHVAKPEPQYNRTSY